MLAFLHFAGLAIKDLLLEGLHFVVALQVVARVANHPSDSKARELQLAFLSMKKCVTELSLERLWL